MCSISRLAAARMFGRSTVGSRAAAARRRPGAVGRAPTSGGSAEPRLELAEGGVARAAEAVDRLVVVADHDHVVGLVGRRGRAAPAAGSGPCSRPGTRRRGRGGTGAGSAAGGSGGPRTARSRGDLLAEVEQRRARGSCAGRARRPPPPPGAGARRSAAASRRYVGLRPLMALELLPASGPAPSRRVAVAAHAASEPAAWPRDGPDALLGRRAGRRRTSRGAERAVRRTGSTAAPPRHVRPRRASNDERRALASDERGELLRRDQLVLGAADEVRELAEVPGSGSASGRGRASARGAAGARAGAAAGRSGRAGCRPPGSPSSARCAGSSR